LNNFSYVCNLLIPQLNSRQTGFGRNENEALKTALINLFETCLQDEKLLIPIKDSLKIFLRNNKENFDIINYKHLPHKESKEESTKNVFLNECKQLQISQEINFSINYGQNKFKEILKENHLILLELDKLILDMMEYNKVILQII
jgi:hypothetical protein